MHDRDGAFAAVAATIAHMNIGAVRTAPRFPWAERLRGTRHRSIRREWLDHVIVMNEAGLRRVLTRCIAYYMRCRTHLALAKD